MAGALVHLLCPECEKDWEMNPTELPVYRDNYLCQSCGAMRRTAEFMWTEHDLQTFKQFEQ